LLILGRERGQFVDIGGDVFMDWNFGAFGLKLDVRCLGRQLEMASRD